MGNEKETRLLRDSDRISFKYHNSATSSRGSKELRISEQPELFHLDMVTLETLLTDVSVKMIESRSINLSFSLCLSLCVCVCVCV